MEEQNIVLLGKAGSGKGTQAKLLEKECNLLHISTGEILRKNEYQEEFKKYTTNGELVPNDLMIKILNKEIEILKEKHKNNGIILDGFPRSKEQAEQLNKILDLNKTVIINLEISNKTAEKRINGRAKTDGTKARKDDLDINSIKKRIEIYEENYKAIKEVFTKLKVRFINVEADTKTIKKINQEITEQLIPENSIASSTQSNEKTARDLAEATEFISRMNINNKIII